MRWYIINVKKHKFFIALASVILFLVFSLSISISAVERIHRSELFITTGTEINNSKIIIIDAGHGGEDSGAVGVDGSLEKNIALSLAFEIGNLLEEKGYAVVYTRTTDALLYKPEENIKGIRKISDLKNRCEVAKNYPESVFVSVHLNSFSQEKYSGLQTYYSENNELSREIAESIQHRVREDVQPVNNRVIKEGKDMYLMENIDNPAVLIECGFLSNIEECEKLSKKEYQKQLSFSIVCGIIEAIE